jgi:hypothetical protein
MSEKDRRILAYGVGGMLLLFAILLRVAGTHPDSALLAVVLVGQAFTIFVLAP